MTTVFKAAAASLLATLSLTGAHAAVLDLSLSGANVFAFNDFKASGSDVEGSIMAGRDVTLTNYAVNKNNVDAFGAYSLIAGRNLSLTSGSILNGATYAGGTSKIQQASVASPVTNKAPAVNMTAMASSLTATSKSLSKLTSTAAAEQKWGGVYITGSKSGVEVINLDANWLNSSTYYNFSNMKAGATLVVNFSGKTANFANGYDAFNGYNVVFNLVDATQINIGTGLNASLLAPNASILGGNGVINGKVAVKDWSSSVQINSGRAFSSINVPGLVSTVPEAETYAMLLTGLGLIGFIARRRKAAAAR